MTKNANEFSFEDHVHHLGRFLREKYDLVVERHSDTSVHMKNDLVVVNFHSGWPSDPYVNTSVSYSEDTVFRSHAKTGSVDIRFYAAYKKIDLCLFYPSSILTDGSVGIDPLDDPYFSIGSPIQLLADIIFLNVFGSPLLEINRTEIGNFANWYHDQCVAASKAFSQPKE